MKRWRAEGKHGGDYVERPDIDAFIEEVLEVCERHKFAIGHEDGHGAFEIYDGPSDSDKNWLRCAKDETKADK